MYVYYIISYKHKNKENKKDKRSNKTIKILKNLKINFFIYWYYLNLLMVFLSYDQQRERE